MGLKERLYAIGTGLGVGALAIGNSGCVTPEMYAGMSNLHPDMTPREASIAASQGIARYQVAKDLAERSRPVVNVNVNTGDAKTVQSENQTKRAVSKSAPPSPPLKVFVCNYYKDFNNDGLISDDEYVGIGKKFSRGERIAFVGKLGNHWAGGKGLFKLFDQNGNKMYEHDFECTTDNFTMGIQYPTHSFKPGTYVGTFYYNGRFRGKTEIKVTPTKSGD